jgi:DNA (cytosine-5)-methyltransferase 1
MCEKDPAARAVLRAHFPDVIIWPDVRDVKRLPAETDMVVAGFPCQDLSQAGKTNGIAGDNSGLVGEALRIVGRNKPQWVLFENVPFMLRLQRGAAIRYITEYLAEKGYHWAYRVIDTRAFGIPQRRKRVFLLASLEHDPGAVLFQGDHSFTEPDAVRAPAFGFYWTEGNRGLGWAADAIPTLKGGSGFGIPSPPAIWWKGKGLVTPTMAKVHDGD